MGRVRSKRSDGRDGTCHRQREVCTCDEHCDAGRKAAKSLGHNLHAQRSHRRWCRAGEFGAWQMWRVGVGGVAKCATAAVSTLAISHCQQLQDFRIAGVWFSWCFTAWFHFFKLQNFHPSYYGSCIDLNICLNDQFHHFSRCYQSRRCILSVMQIQRRIVSSYIFRPLKNLCVILFPCFLDFPGIGFFCRWFWGIFSGVLEWCSDVFRSLL